MGIYSHLWRQELINKIPDDWNVEIVNTNPFGVIRDLGSLE